MQRFILFIVLLSSCVPKFTEEDAQRAMHNVPNDYDRALCSGNVGTRKGTDTDDRRLKVPKDSLKSQITQSNCPV